MFYAAHRDQIEIVGFTFDWKKGSRNDACIIELKKRLIPFCYIMQKLHVKYCGRWCPVDYKHVSGDRYLMVFYDHI